jgi:hypothetical protein
MRVLFLFLLLMLSGCSFGPNTGGWFKEKQTSFDIPSAPNREFAEEEDIKRNIEIITDISQIAYTSGVNAQSYESKVLLQSAKVLQTISGLPTEKIDYTSKREVEELHKNILDSEAEYRLEKAEWETLINDLGKDNSILEKQNGILKNSLESFKFWFWFCVILLIGLCFFAPTVGIPLVRFLLGRAKKLGETAVVETASALKGQMSQIVEAIEDYKKVDPENSAKLLQSLEKKTDSGTRHLINELKVK